MNWRQSQPSAGIVNTAIRCLDCTIGAHKAHIFAQKTNASQFKKLYQASENILCLFPPYKYNPLAEPMDNFP